MHYWLLILDKYIFGMAHFPFRLSTPNRSETHSHIFMSCCCYVVFSINRMFLMGAKGTAIECVYIGYGSSSFFSLRLSLFRFIPLNATVENQYTHNVHGIWYFISCCLITECEMRRRIHNTAPANMPHAIECSNWQMLWQFLFSFVRWLFCKFSGISRQNCRDHGYDDGRTILTKGRAFAIDRFHYGIAIVTSFAYRMDQTLSRLNDRERKRQRARWIAAKSGLQCNARSIKCKYTQCAHRRISKRRERESKKANTANDWAIEWVSERARATKLLNINTAKK